MCRKGSQHRASSASLSLCIYLFPFCLLFYFFSQLQTSRPPALPTWWERPASDFSGLGCINSLRFWLSSRPRRWWFSLQSKVIQTSQGGGELWRHKQQVEGYRSKLLVICEGFSLLPGFKLFDQSHCRVYQTSKHCRRKSTFLLFIRYFTVHATRQRMHLWFSFDIWCKFMFKVTAHHVLQVLCQAYSLWGKVSFRLDLCGFCFSHVCW